MKKIGLILVVFAFLVYCASTGQSQEVSPDVGDNAPDFSIVDVSGNEIRLGDFKEKRMLFWFFMPIVLVVWPTGGSVSCKKEFPRSKNLMPR